MGGWLAVDRKTGKHGAVLWKAKELAEYKKLYPKTKFKFRYVWCESWLDDLIKYPWSQPNQAYNKPLNYNKN